MYSLSRASLQKVLKCWQGLGYYQRARNVYEASKLMCRRYRGKVPHEAAFLRQLPGFGPYTVGAVMSIAFGQRYLLVDANVRRVVMRQLALTGHADSSQDKKIRAFLERVFPQKMPGEFNQGLMELGALVCRGKEPLCNLCPVKESCRAYQKGIQEVIPSAKKKEIHRVNVVVGVIQHGKKFLIQQRPPQGLLAGLWEFPGGKIEPHEQSPEALAREIKEELGVRIKNSRFLFHLTHFYTQFQVKLHVWACTLAEWPREEQTRQWCTLKKMKEFPMPSGSARILDRLQDIKGKLFS